MTQEQQQKEIMRLLESLRNDIREIAQQKAELEADNYMLREALKLAGKVALSASAVITSSALNVSGRITELEQDLDKYNAIIFNNLKQ